MVTDAERLAEARRVAAEWHAYALRARNVVSADFPLPLIADPFARGLDAGHAAMGHALACVMEALGPGPDTTAAESRPREAPRDR